MHTPTLFKTPFRAWFFNGSCAGAVLILPWLLSLNQPLTIEPIMGWFWWHQHEMVYALATPFLLGFLLTASSNWTGHSPVTAPQTLFMFGLWWCARLLQFLLVPTTLLMVVDMAPLLIGFILLSRLLIQHKNYRNLIMSAALLALFISGVMQYLDPGKISQWSRFSILVVVWIITILSGRVVPFFTAKRINVKKVEPIRGLEIGLLVYQLTITLLLPFVSPHLWLQAFALGVAMLSLVRWARWQRWALWRIPLLWGLHLGYFFLITGWFCVAALGFNSTAVHLFAIGGIGIMVIAFGGRVSLAHAGHPLIPPKTFILSLLLLTLAVALRALLPLIFTLPAQLQYSAAGWLWSLAFLLFTISYASIWFKPRADGKAEQS